MISNHWQPDQDAVKREYSKIEKVYGTRRVKGKIPEGFENTVWEFAKISVFLQDKAAGLNQLKKLNDLLVEEAKNCNIVVNEQDPNEYFRHQKLLRNVLERELAKLGFQPNFAKATDYLPPEVFRSTVREGLILKDPGAGLEHGEFTHAIQWLIIGWQQRDTNFLKIPVIEVFKQLGDDRAVTKKSEYDENNIWNLLVDEDIDICKDYRCPEYLHHTILDKENPNFPLLKKLCESRRQKREESISLFFEDKNKREYEISDLNKNLLISRKKNK